MSKKDLIVAIELVNESGVGDFEGEKCSVLVEKAEAALGLRFPDTYRTFLTELGCGDIEGLEFYGVIGDDFENSNVPDAVWLTLSERKSGLPKNLVIVSTSGDGAYYALDTEQVSSEGENPVVRYMPSGKAENIAEDYGEFMLSELKTVL